MLGFELASTAACRMGSEATVSTPTFVMAALQTEPPQKQNDSFVGWLLYNQSQMSQTQTL
jgi:hypothetical protein